MYEDKKTENWNNECIAQDIDKMHCQVSPLSYASNTKNILFETWCLLIPSISLL